MKRLLHTEYFESPRFYAHNQVSQALDNFKSIKEEWLEENSSKIAKVEREELIPLQMTNSFMFIIKLSYYINE